VVSKKVPGMRRQILLVCGFALLSAAGLSAQQLLPSQFGKWQAVPAASSARAATNLTNSPDQDRDILKESKALPSEQRTFSNGESQLTVSLEQLPDPTDAYEVFTYSLTPGMTPSDLGQSSYVGRDRAVILIGNLVLCVNGLENASVNDLKEIVEALQSKADRTPLPPIRNYMPLDGLLFGSQRYALGPAGLHAGLDALGLDEFTPLVNEAGFSNGAEAMLARYENGKNGGAMLLIEYPTPQLAEQHLHHLEQVLPAPAAAAGTKIERRGSLLSMVLSPSSPAYAESLSKAVSYETQLTWNEPSQTMTDPPWPSVIARIFIGTGIFMVAAVVLGIAFGGVRVVTKIFFPGKVFDRPEDMEILQLGLSGKPIDPRDFY
jgi:Family of unknown function (DUF6599)